MCKDIGIPQATFTKWKNENKSPSFYKILEIAKYLEISIDELAEIKEKEKKEITKKQEELINAYEKAPGNIKDIIDTALEPYKENNSKSSISKIG